MSVKVHNLRSQEKGNALFLVLIAVALFAALSYAITSTGRGSGTIEREAAMVAAGQITQYPALLRSIVTRMVLSGIPVTSVDFTAGSGPAKVFDPAGGGTIRQAPPPNIGGATAWAYEPDTGSLGYYVKDVGSNADGGREVLAYLSDVTLTVCAQIQKGLRLPETPPPASVEIVWATPAATFDTDGSTIKGADLDGVPFSCMDNNGVYVYYHVLAEQ